MGDKQANSKVAPFWETKRLEELDAGEWESLCDGCGLCCLHKLEDVDTGEIHYTDVACRLLDIEQCRCTQYRRRHELVSDCVRLSAEHLEALEWMPSTCAYRLRYEGKPLPKWHPLVSGDAASARLAGKSIRGWAVPEQTVDLSELEERIVRRKL
jgi:uncharacterized cysteine cluster protein YcgN (CxxCxxCC family)